MVRNTFGGKGAKSMAAKSSSGAANSKLTLSTDKSEVYAIATKMLGNCTCNCIGIDGVLRLAHIRGKFSGKGKRDNTINLGTWLLVGDYQWTASSEALLKKGKVKLQECDILEVYSDREKQRLKDSISENWDILEENDPNRKIENMQKKSDTNIVFQSEKEAEIDRLTEEINSTETIKISLDTKSANDTLSLDDVFDI
jgi:translation initiation factor IF-1